LETTDFLYLTAGVENAKTLGWVLEMCFSNSATFFSCIVTGITFIYVENFPCLSLVILVTAFLTYFSVAVTTPSA
jgi:hypothetical protein